MASDPPTMAMFPGTFDPPTNGHIDLIQRAQGMFDELVVAIGHNPEKTALFTPEQRRRMIERICAEQNLAVRVATYDGLTVDFAQQIGARIILRGIRNHSDLNFEFQLAMTNRAVADVETVFIMTGEQHGFVSSTLIKQIAASGRMEHLQRLLPPLVVDAIAEKMTSDRDSLESLRTDAHKE